MPELPEVEGVLTLSELGRPMPTLWYGPWANQDYGTTYVVLSVPSRCAIKARYGH
jgi:hypothetical protein